MRVLLFTLALFVVEALATRAHVRLEFVAREHGVAAALLWTALRAATVTCVALLLLAERRAVRLATLVTLGSLFVTHLGVRAANDAGITVTLVRLALAERQYAGTAVSFHLWRAIGWAVLGIGILQVAWSAVHRVVRPRMPPRVTAPAATLLVVLASAAVMSPWASFLPAFVEPASAMVDVLVHPEHPAARAPVSLPRARPRARHVVVLVDESIRGDLVGTAARGRGLDSTPWLAANADRFADFGLASAATNCSLASNAVLLTGLRPRDLPDREQRLRRLPTLFDHARDVGMRTVLVDAQSITTAAPHALASGDLARLDRHVVIRLEHGGDSWADADAALADAVVEATASEAPTFVYANKWGAHYPYGEGVPPEARVSTAERAERAGFTHAPVEAALYLDAVRWSVDRFFESLVPRLAGRDVWVVYTSDHGESLLDDGVARTHCSESPAPRAQGIVPLLVFRGDRTRRDERLDAFDDAAATHMRDHASAFQIFPTVLEALGYAREAVRAQHGPSLDETPSAGSRAVFSGDLRGKGPFWRAPVQ